jgi:hypothetical protein
MVNFTAACADYATTERKEIASFTCVCRKGEVPKCEVSPCQELRLLIRDRGGGGGYCSFIDPMQQEGAALQRRVESH